MSRIEKLSIEGVRSFSPLGRQHLTLHTPLTLIVGMNGSGKTTVIECLKYATTGELPPNSKGGAFIHDPKLCNSNAVKAQVKLRFKSPSNDVYIITRSVELTVKRTARSMKTLDSNLAIEYTNGSKDNKSSKVDDVNKIITQTLGASPAVLDAVIFCHQEESLWPMSEPGSLKKRFDEIFEAMKYTKAIDNLKALRKKQREKLAKHELAAKSLKQDKEKADRCTSLRLRLEKEINELQEKQQEYSRERDVAKRQAAKRNEDAESFRRIVNDLGTKRDELRFRQETLETSRERMDEELHDSDEALRDALARYAEVVARSLQDLEDMKAQDKSFEDDLEDSRYHLDKQLAEQGRHQSDKEKYERQVGARVDLVRETAQLHNVRGFDGDLDDRKVRAFYDRIQKLYADRVQELERLKSERNSEYDSQTTKITDLEGQKARYTQTRSFARKRIVECEKNVATRQRELNSVDADEGAKALLDTNYEDLEAQFLQANRSLQVAGFDSKILAANKRSKDLESESSRLGRDLVEATRLVHDRAQLDFRKDELVEKKKKLATLKTTWDDKLCSLVDGDWEPSNIEQKFNIILQTKITACEEASRQRDVTVQELKLVQADLANLRQAAKKRDADITRCADAVLRVLKKQRPDDNEFRSVGKLADLIEETEFDIVEIKKAMVLVEKLGDFYLECEQVMNEKNKCNLCDRAFTHPSEKTRLIAKVKKSIERVAKGEYQTELDEAETKLEELLQVRPQSETHNRLISERKTAAKEQTGKKDKEDTLLRRLEEMDDDVRAKQDARQDFESLNKTVLNISQAHKDIGDANAQIELILSQQQSAGAIRSPAEIQEELEDCSKQLAATKTSIDKLTSDRQTLRDAISGLQLKRSELKNKISHAERQLERKKEIQELIQAHKDDITKSKETVQQADNDLGSVEPEIVKAYTIRDDTAQRGQEKEKKVDKDREGLWSSVSELKRIDADIQGYLDAGGPANLKANEQNIEALKKTIKRIQEDMRALRARSEKMEKDIASNDGKKRNIDENLKHRKAARDVEKLNRAVLDLESRRAHEDYARLVDEAKEFENEKNLKNAEIAAALGEIKSKDNELKRQEEEWNSELQFAAQNYREAHIRVETTKAAIDDIGRYTQALNHAIMQYHTMKMEQVNQIIAELWRSTYQGTDIDTILIRSDSGTSTGERSTYNYRVCMVKQDTEMDMRGRCSAGQKVLASILIRLALAETFGIGCGLIALDEPTTNLDQDNIESLATSLHEIIKTRRSQSNFQLIVITHDEHFLKAMSCSDFCDEYWNVKRDERQCSLIQRESISSLH